jgi:hypothetical protein
MNPADALKGLSNLDSTLATVIYAGLAVFAAAAVVIGWKVDIEVAVRIGLYILAFAVVVVVIGAIAGSPGLRLFVGWAFAIILILVAVAFLVSTVFQPTWIAPPYCMVEFWKRCSDPGGPADQYAERNYAPPIPVQPTVTAPPANAVTPAEYRVFVQFAGVIRREDIQALAAKLRSTGWQVQGRSGERTTAAIGYNEIRYTDARDEAAARKLAIEVQTANLVSTPIAITKINGIQPRTLEVWVSRT